MSTSPSLSPRMILAMMVSAIVFAAPAIYMVEKSVCLGAWVIELQEQLMDGSFWVSSVVLVMLLEFLMVAVPLFVIAVLVRSITGTTIVEHCRRLSNRTGDG